MFRGIGVARGRDEIREIKVGKWQQVVDHILDNLWNYSFQRGGEGVIGINF